ncbi:MAG: hypothetical protein AAF512_21815, partial [Pseudomonadota bacterium]
MTVSLIDVQGHLSVLVGFVRLDLAEALENFPFVLLTAEYGNFVTVIKFQQYSIKTVTNVMADYSEYQS